jgi:hypothetical protein
MHFALGRPTSHFQFLREVSDPDTDEFILVLVDCAGRHKLKKISERDMLGFNFPEHGTISMQRLRAIESL